MEIYVGKHMSLGDAESVYDQMYAEFFGDRKKTRKKPDARTRAERMADWEAEKDLRKDRRIDAKCNHINKKYGYLCIEQERRISAEKVARADWELEQLNIEIARLDAELEAEYAEWEARREWEDMCRKLTEWLKYA